MSFRNVILTNIYKSASERMKSYKLEVSKGLESYEEVFSFKENLMDNVIIDFVNQAKKLDSGRYYVYFDLKSEVARVEDLIDNNLSIKISRTEETGDNSGEFFDLKSIMDR